MSVDLRVQVAEETIRQIEKQLDAISNKNKESVLKTAVNNTAKKAQSLLAQKAAAEYSGKKSRKGVIMAASSIKKATTSGPSATITFKSPVHEIKEFHVSSLDISKTTFRKDGKRGGKNIKGNVLKGSPKKLDYAFVVRFKSGHVAVVSRIPGTQMKSNPKKEKLRKLLSPSYKVMVGGAKVYDAMEPDIKKVLSEEISKIIDNALGGK